MPARRTDLPRARARRHLILAGGGHSHVAVLRSFAMRPEPDLRITLVSPAPHSVYSGMVPGRLAGLYGPEDASIDVAALAARADAAYLEDELVEVDERRSVVRLGQRGEIPFDLLSLDVGSRPLGIGGLPADPAIVGVKPVEAAAERIAAFLERTRVEGGGRVAVIGGGAGGVEVAFALRSRLPAAPAGRVVLVEADPTLLPGGSPRLRRCVDGLVRRYGIEVHTGRRFSSFAEGRVHLDDGSVLEADLVVWATGAEGHPFLGASGLPVDDRGFVWVDDHLRCEKGETIFAAGDCARLRSHPDMPRAGVYAVREGPILAENLRRALRGRSLIRYHPQSDFLSLLSTGDGRAAVSYRGWAGHGRLWWRLKDWIDRRFIARYAPPRPAGLRRGPEVAARMDKEMEPCGGCAAKLAPDLLERTLGGLASPENPEVSLGLAQRDDAAILRAPPRGDLVFTIDAFPPFLSDPLVVGEVAALNALSDVWAMGGRPTAVLALVGVSARDGASREADLRQMLTGARQVLDRLGVALVGGHTIEGEAPLLGFAVVGSVQGEETMTKARAAAGDRLVLTKPLGTGVILAALRAGECPAGWAGEALSWMRVPNDVASRVFVGAGVRACTDVSGFGLAGHLGEMLDASGLTAELWSHDVPALPGALELLEHEWRSSAHATLEETAARRFRRVDLPPGHPRETLLSDPQTGGGLLAAVPEASWSRVAAELEAAGVPATSIGRLHSGPAGEIRLLARGGPATPR